ncbi:hypothetical protein L6452_38983 [Arctium lappa]|uniref:Uncharacterized protein n=1 Tax=Arctium lappa TaxID=4217 RepID=A0ACB8XR18_ARCLA|nr:hypothetical protein L6452_38983 [Arctium lappa]
MDPLDDIFALNSKASPSSIDDDKEAEMNQEKTNVDGQALSEGEQPQQNQHSLVGGRTDDEEDDANFIPHQPHISAAPLNESVLTAGDEADDDEDDEDDKSPEISEEEVD